MIRRVFRRYVWNRWMAIAPVAGFAVWNAFLVLNPVPELEPRLLDPIEIRSSLEGIDLDLERQRQAARLESRPVKIQFGDEVAQGVRQRIVAHLREASTEPVDIVDTKVEVDTLPDDVLAIGIGEAKFSEALIDDRELDTLDAEGYILRSGVIENRSVIASAGDATGVGVNYGAYALLEVLGFGFLHPLEPTPPLALPGVAPDVDRDTSPRWPVRGLQLHTMHPLELTDLLQGWGPGGPDDEAGWRTMLGDWDAFLDWMLANGQNRVHWVWLAADSWSEFAASSTRIERVRQVVERAQEFGIEVGLTVPIRLQQQNAGRLIESEGSLEAEIAQIEAGVGHVMEAGFDYLTTKPGTTEFTAVDDHRMLAWMNALVETADDDHGVPVYIKVHASRGQYAEAFPDPNTGEPINFNFLPQFADERLGVLPHTVQHYSLSDPAPTYGNEDFGHIREFLHRQAGSRPTVWFPETAYWVSFDNDVPLFLPVYASRRVHDLRLLAGDEEAGRMGRGEHAGATMDGQLTFSSGWEWGYWVQEVATARAAWNPRTDLDSDEAALKAVLEPMERVFGEAGEPVLDWLTDYISAQQDLLIEGVVEEEIPSTVIRRNGQAYLQGWETWDDISHTAADWFGMEEGRMQPDRISPIEMRRSKAARAEYRQAVAPLLSAMDNRFEALLDDLQQLRPLVPVQALELYDEFEQAAQVTALRARQVRQLYAYIHAEHSAQSDAVSKAHLSRAQDALDEALAVVAKRESNYRVPTERIASWRANPTVYPFTYLWTVRTLFYWQRDEAQAITGSKNPCLFNIIDPVDVVVDDGWISEWTSRSGRAMTMVPAFRGIGKCLRAPTAEPEFLPVRWKE